jgi:hypothetical protein
MAMRASSALGFTHGPRSRARPTHERTSLGPSDGPEQAGRSQAAIWRPISGPNRGQSRCGQPSSERATIASVLPLARFNAAGVVLISVLLWATTTAVASPFASSGASRERALSSSEVVRAFAASGVTMYDPMLGAEMDAVSLTATNSPRAYDVGATIYPSARLADLVYHGEMPEWVAAGFDVALRGNVIVTVVPKGAVLGRKPRSRVPMPAAITKSLGILAADLTR